MIASTISLDRQSIKVLKLSNLYSIHSFVYSLFPGTQRDFLYYDQKGDKYYRKLLILSKRQPLVPEVGIIESRYIPESFLNYREYAFQILLNPVEQLSGNKNKVPIKSKDSLLLWFLKRQESWGFVADMNTLDVFNSGVQIIRKDDRKITHNMAEFRGILRVTDRERFSLSFSDGIGRGKAFGFGLLQIRPINENV